MEQAKALSLDIVIMDISMPALNGIEATRCLLAEAPATKILTLSTHSQKRFIDEMPRVRTAMRAKLGLGSLYPLSGACPRR